MSVSILIFYYYVPNYHKPKGLKQCPFVSSLFCRLEAWGAWLDALSGSHNAEIKIAEAKLASYLKALEKKTTLKLIQGFARIQFLVVEGLMFPFFYWPLARAALIF